MASNRGAASRRKGKRGEQEVAVLLRPVFPAVRTKRAGGESAAEDRGRDLLGTPGLCVQAKCHAKPQPIAALAEARRAALEAEMPVAFVRQSSRRESSPWCVILDAQDFVGLLSLAKGELELVRLREREANGVALVAPMDPAASRTAPDAGA